MDSVKHTIDVGAAFAALATVMHWMPAVAALLTTVWYVIRITEWVINKRAGRK